MALAVAAASSACGGLLAPGNGDDGGTSTVLAPTPVPDAHASSSSDSSVPPRETGAPDVSMGGSDAMDAGRADDASAFPEVSVPSSWITCDSSACAPVVLATDMPRPWAIAVDDRAVYTGNCGGTYGPGSITRIALDGDGASTLVASPDPMDPGESCYAVALAIDATDLYWTSYGATAFVAKVPLTGGQATLLGQGNIQSTAFGVAVESTNLYWNTSNQVIRQPLDGGAPIVMATTSEGANALAVDATNVYWASGTAIMKTALAGGPSVQLVATSAGRFGSGIAVDTENLYWGEPTTNALMSVPLEGGAPTAWVGTDGISDIAVDDTRIYWTTGTGVWSLPKSGGPLVQLASSPGAEAIALDSTAVYFTALLGADSQSGTDSVLRVPK